MKIAPAAPAMFAARAALTMKTIITSNWRPLRRALCTLLLGIAALWAMPRSVASSITFTLQGTASGTLVNNGAPVSFSNAPYSFSIVTDTSLISTSGSNPPGGTFYYTPFVSGGSGGTVSIDGVTGTWSNGVGVYNYVYPSTDPSSESISFTEQISNGLFFFTFGSNASLLNYALQSAIGPLPLSSEGVNFYDYAVTTSFGSFTLTSLSSETFTATTTPIPFYVAQYSTNSAGEYDAITGAVINANFITGLNGPSDSRCRATTSSWRTTFGSGHGWQIRRHHGSRDQRQLHHGAERPRRDSRCRATTSSWRTTWQRHHGWRIRRHHGRRDQRQLHHGAERAHRTRGVGQQPLRGELTGAAARLANTTPLREPRLTPTSSRG